MHTCEEKNGLNHPMTLGVLFTIKTLVSCFWDFERFFCISIYYTSMLSLHWESTDFMIPTRW